MLRKCEGTVEQNTFQSLLKIQTECCLGEKIHYSHYTKNMSEKFVPKSLNGQLQRLRIFAGSLR